MIRNQNENYRSLSNDLGVLYWITFCLVFSAFLVSVIFALVTLKNLALLVIAIPGLLIMYFKLPLFPLHRKTILFNNDHLLIDSNRIEYKHVASIEKNHLVITREGGNYQSIFCRVVFNRQPETIPSFLDIKKYSIILAYSGI